MAKLDPAIGRYVYLDVQGIEYRVYFEQNGTGIPLICQHTAASDGRLWRHLLNDEEITRKFQVIVPDLPITASPCHRNPLNGGSKNTN